MAQVTSDIQAVKNAYVERVERILPVERAILFGSQARGSATAQSDIDIAIISPAFTNMKRVDSFVLLMGETHAFDADIQPYPDYVEDLQDPVDIFEEILTTGTDIMMKNNDPRYVLMEFSQFQKEELADGDDVHRIGKRIIASNHRAFGELSK